jgi:hypothetical protein
MVENSALIFENMSVVFIYFKNLNLFRFLGSHDLWLHFRPHNVYFFELSIKFYIKSSRKTLKLVNFSYGCEKGAKNSYGSYPTEFVPEVKNTKKTPVRPIPSVIQKEKCLT